MTSEQREQYWRVIQEKWTKSGQTQKEFCRRHSLSLPSFRWWRSELKRRGDKRDRLSGTLDKSKDNSRLKKQRFNPAMSSNANEPSFVPVEIVGTNHFLLCSSESEHTYEILLRGGRRIRLGRHFESESLKALIATVEQAE
jgi:hypothetical protein